MTPGTAALDWPCGYVLERRTPEMMKGFFLSRSLPVPQAGSFAEPRKKDAPCVWPVLQMIGALCEREESVDGMVFLRPDDGMKLGGTLVGSFAPLPSLMVPPKRFVPASYVERGRDCVVYVSSLPERHIRSH